MTLFEMIKTRPYEMQQEFSCGVRKQNENEVLVSVWRPKAKKCQLAVIAEGKNDYRKRVLWQTSGKSESLF